MTEKELMKYLFEAPGDEGEPTPEETAPDETTAPPDDAAGGDDTAPDMDPPDINDDAGGDDPDSPPDMGDDSFDDYDIASDEEGATDMKLDEKISAVLNMNLYQKFLTLLSDIGTKLSSIKSNSDILFVITDSTPEVMSAMKRLDENLRLYIKNSFTNERYENNLLFFNKCWNLYKLLTDKFASNLNKGVKELN